MIEYIHKFFGFFGKKSKFIDPDKKPVKTYDVTSEDVSFLEPITPIEAYDSSETIEDFINQLK